jgi:hypothetical protein
VFYAAFEQQEQEPPENMPQAKKGEEGKFLLEGSLKLDTI